MADPCTDRDALTADVARILNRQLGALLPLDMDVIAGSEALRRAAEAVLDSLAPASDQAALTEVIDNVLFANLYPGVAATILKLTAAKAADAVLAVLGRPGGAGREADSDPADYGYSDLPKGRNGVRIIPSTPPEETVCRACGRVAIEHTRGRFSIYGVCPTDEGPQ